MPVRMARRELPIREKIVGIVFSLLPFRPGKPFVYLVLNSLIV